MDLSKIVRKGSKIQTFSCSGEVDNTIYEVIGKVRSKLNLVNVDTGKSHEVHRSRIARILDDECKEVQVDGKKKKEAPEAPKVQKEKKEKKVKKEIEKVNFADLNSKGYQVWSMPVKFTNKGKDVKDVNVEAHCVIAPDKKSFRVFNTYNGSLGKKSTGKLGVEFQIKDEKAYEKKVKSLESKGYKKNCECP